MCINFVTLETKILHTKFGFDVYNLVPYQILHGYVQQNIYKLLPSGKVNTKFGRLLVIKCSTEVISRNGSVFF